MTIQIALCDDEKTELEKIKILLRAYEQKQTDADLMIDCFEHTDQLLDRIRERGYAPDLVFMDIYMSEEGGQAAPMGMDAARQLRDMGSRTRLIFLTASKEHALDAFDVEASQYLLKPASADRLFYILDRFLEDADKEQKKYILLRVNGMLTRVSLNDIVYCEAHGKRQRIYMSDGTELLQNLTMVKIYEMCSVCPGFVKVGASYIIHLEHIESMNAQEVQMDNGRTIYLPRGTYRCLREQYFDHYCGGV